MATPCATARRIRQGRPAGRAGLCVGEHSSAVTRGQETVGSYIDDATITTQIKSRFVENKVVDAGSIQVKTLNGTVMLSGFAKSANEKTTAETIARGVNGVKLVKNELSIRP
jgi:hyperosmotically inducible periplasmic protein